jgi:hypothetical protein
LQAPKKSKQKMAFSCGGHFLHDCSSRSIHIGFTDQSITHPHRLRVVTFGPGAALQRGGFWRMLHGLVLFSNSVTFKPAQETTALKIVVITTEY